MSESNTPTNVGSTAGLGVTAQSVTPHIHRCMSCGQAWYCPHPPGDCRAKEDVFPTLILRGPEGQTLFHHACQAKKTPNAQREP